MKDTRNYIKILDLLLFYDLFYDDLAFQQKRFLTLYCSHSHSLFFLFPLHATKLFKYSMEKDNHFQLIYLLFKGIKAEIGEKAHQTYSIYS